MDTARERRAQERERLMGKFSLALGIGVGYVLGSRAGHARYEQIQQAAVRLSARPEVQDAAGRIRDTLPAPLQSAVEGLTSRASGGRAGGTDSGVAAAAAAAGPVPLEDDPEVVARTQTALQERDARTRSTDDPGTTAASVR